MAQLHKPRASIPPPSSAPSNRLFTGIWLRWSVLTVPERFVCANIVFIPIWWVLGLYQFMSLLLLLGVVAYECWYTGKFQLQKPSVPVVALFGFGVYIFIRRFFLFVRVLGGLKEAIVNAFCPALWLWYIQSKNIKVRLEVVAWAFTVLVVQMLGFWFLLQFVIPESVLFPPLPTVLAFLTGQPVGDGNYDINALVAYTPRLLFGEAQNRFSLFFIFPEFLGLMTACIGAIALELKHRLWLGLLLFACAFLIFLSATRMIWVAFPIVVILHYLYKNVGKTNGAPVLLAALALLSFAVLSVPPVTDLVFGKVTGSIEAVNQVRAGSSAVRMEIYRITWAAIQENPLWGYGFAPEETLSSEIRIGSHSASLGNLLYEKGLVGTVIFAWFWVSLLLWFYKTRTQRPLTAVGVWLLYTLVSPTMALVYTIPISQLVMLLCVTLRNPQAKSTRPQSFFKKIHHA